MYHYILVKYLNDNNEEIIKIFQNYEKDFNNMELDFSDEEYLNNNT